MSRNCTTYRVVSGIETSAADVYNMGFQDGVELGRNDTLCEVLEYIRNQVRKVSECTEKDSKSENTQMCHMEYLVHVLKEMITEIELYGNLEKEED